LRARFTSLSGANQAATASALLRWIGRTYQTDGDADAALDCLEGALAIAELAGDQAAVGSRHQLQAIVLLAAGRSSDQAEGLYLRAP
jgi:hypothetical protein